MTITKKVSKVIISAIIFFPLAGNAQTPRLSIEGRAQLVTDEFNVRVSGLKPNQKIVLQTHTTDQRERPWISSASFISNKNGIVSLKTQAPEEGSYSGVDPMGLFWSATYNGLPPDSTRAVFSRRALRNFTTKISLNIEGDVIDSLKITRNFISEGVIRDSINYQNFKGIFYRPKNVRVNGAVIVLAGSDGGITSADWRAALLASNGIPALALAFFDYGDLPNSLIELPLEYVNGAIAFLREHNHDKIALLGFSKGSELALAYASKVNNDINAIVAISPSSYVWQGINRNVDVKSSWTMNDNPLDFVKWQYNTEVIQMLRSRGSKNFRLLYNHSLKASDSLSLANAELNLEKTKGPVLLIAGGDDGSWPADIMVNRLYDFKKREDTDFDIEKLIFDSAGHLIYFDFLPVTDSRAQGGQFFGGTIEANIEARRKSWLKTLGFLNKNLN